METILKKEALQKKRNMRYPHKIKGVYNRGPIDHDMYAVINMKKKKKKKKIERQHQMGTNRYIEPQTLPDSLFEDPIISLEPNPPKCKHNIKPQNTSLLLGSRRLAGKDPCCFYSENSNECQRAKIIWPKCLERRHNGEGDELYFPNLLYTQHTS